MDVQGTKVMEVIDELLHSDKQQNEQHHQGRDTSGRGITITSLDDVKMVIHNLVYPKDNEAVNQTFEKLEQKTHLRREQIVYAGIGLVFLYMVFGAFAKLMCNCIGFMYPAYASVKAIRTAQKKDDTNWLIYWTVFAAFSLLDFFFETLFSYFPVYWVLKAVFLLYLYLPQTYGALVFYNRCIDPAITKVDAFIQKRAEKKTD